MALRPLDLMEPEETVGDLWHDFASGIGAVERFDHAAVTLARNRSSLLLLFRALGGGGSVELVEAPSVRSTHRLSAGRKLGAASETQHIATFDGLRLALPPTIDVFPDKQLNRAAYFWLTASAAFAVCPDNVAEPLAFDRQQVSANAATTRLVLLHCPGLRAAYAKMSAYCLQMRPQHWLPNNEAMIETSIRDHLSDTDSSASDSCDATRGYQSFAPVPIWLRLTQPGQSDTADVTPDEQNAPPPNSATTTRKLGFRKDLNEANRSDSMIIHRFESILSWVECMNLNRSVDDDDDENAQKAADDQDNISLSKHDRRAATRLRLHLDLSPADADHEALSSKFTYPEWNHRSTSYMENHTRVLEVDVTPDPTNDFVPNARRMKEVRRQFEAMRPRRVLRARQIDGTELDLDALIAAQIDLKATGQSSDRIYQNLRQIDRDLAVAVLIDTSRSTEAAVDDTSVIDVARDALAALAGGIDAGGDQLGIWGFSSLNRDRVFLNRCKAFDEPMSTDIINRICALRPGHYTRLGAAIRHVTAMLDKQSASRKLLLVLTDGKPNDLDHYEGQHGIEDSHMAVREARRLGQTVHGVIVDEDGQDWFARIFGRSGFSLLANPARLTRALPDIYRSLTQEV